MKSKVKRATRRQTYNEGWNAAIAECAKLAQLADIGETVTHHAARDVLEYSQRLYREAGDAINRHGDYARMFIRPILPPSPASLPLSMRIESLRKKR